jgi:hypothetical protein
MYYSHGIGYLSRCAEVSQLVLSGRRDNSVGTDFKAIAMLLSGAILFFPSVHWVHLNSLVKTTIRLLLHNAYRTTMAPWTVRLNEQQFSIFSHFNTRTILFVGYSNHNAARPSSPRIRHDGKAERPRRHRPFWQ